MDFRDVVRRRRMHRNFAPGLVAPDVLDRVLDAGRRAPTAGFAQGIEFLVLVGPDQTGRFWDRSFVGGARDRFHWQGLFEAPVLILPMAHAQAYLDRYAEADKAATGLGEGEDRWPVPYWLTDAAMAAQNILLAAVDEGLGALFFGIFTNEDEVLEEFGVPAGRRPVGAIALGHPLPDDPGRSANRTRRPADEVIHRGDW